MLRLQTGPARCCEGTTRRDMLSLGGLATLGWCSERLFSGSLDSLAEAAAPEARVKSVIFVTLYGGPPQTETFDMKPAAPLEARGPFRPIRTNVVNTAICEHLPRLAARADRYALVRSFSHTDTAHAAGLYTLMTGYPHRINNQNSPAHPDDRPHYGAIVSRLQPPKTRVPASVIVGGQILPQFQGIGQTGGFLGKVHSPFVLRDQQRQLLKLREDVPGVRIHRRRELLDSLEGLTRYLDRQRRTANFSTVQNRALKLLESRRFLPAFQLDQESAAVRDRYGRHPLGQNTLMARRLVEAGVPIVQISDIPEGGEQHWDLHYANIFSRLKDRLLPRLDQSVSALLDDLQVRGLLDQTLVIVGGEFGRTPWIDHLTDPPQGGRQHWPFCYSMLLAGGGIRSGQVYGRSDEVAAYPASHKVGPWDLGATLLSQLGIDPATRLPDRRGRLKTICRGTVIDGLL